MIKVIDSIGSYVWIDLNGFVYYLKGNINIVYSILLKERLLYNVIYYLNIGKGE